MPDNYNLKRVYKKGKEPIVSLTKQMWGTFTSIKGNTLSGVRGRKQRLKKLLKET